MINEHLVKRALLAQNSGYSDVNITQIHVNDDGTFLVKYSTMTVPVSFFESNVDVIGYMHDILVETVRQLDVMENRVDYLSKYFT